MKVILQKDISGLGDLGEVKDVAAGYARNYLLPKKLVISAHAGSTRALEHQKRSIAAKALKRKQVMKTLAERLQTSEKIEVGVNVGVEGKIFGSVTSNHLAQLLAKNGFIIDRRKIELGVRIRSLGDYQAKVNLMEGLSVNLNFAVVPNEASLKKMQKEEKEVALEEEAREAALNSSSEKTQEDSKDSETEETPTPASEETQTTASTSVTEE